MPSSRSDTNALQSHLAKMGGGTNTRRRTAMKRSKTAPRRKMKNRTKRRGSIKNRKNRKLRGGAVAPTTAGASQGGSDTLYQAQQQSEANRTFDNA